MSADVSVVVPFFNPGSDLDDCVTSLVQQSLALGRFEILLVDDGSDDGSERRADEWAARYPQVVRVHHEPRSGGPARPRNIGIDRSRGRYVQFVDSDDTLAPAALEDLVRIADASTADIVVSKISAGGPRPVHHPLFRRTVTGLTLDDCPDLVRYGTVCKLFRRDFLTAHDIRFPESSHREDQHFCFRTYALARSIAIAADRVYYFNHRRRSPGEHFGDGALDPAAVHDDIASLLDVVDTEMPTPRTRLAAAARVYRGPVLEQLRGRRMIGYDAAQRRAIVAAMRELAVERLGEGVRASLPAFHRLQSWLLLDGDVQGLTELALRLTTLRLQASAGQPRPIGSHLVLPVKAHLRADDAPLLLEADEAGWLLPGWLAPSAPIEERRFTAAPGDGDLDLDVAVIARNDGSLWSTTDGLALKIGREGRVRVVGEVPLAPGRVVAGGPLAPGRWDVRLRVSIGGLIRAAALHRRGETDSAGPVDWHAPDGAPPRRVTASWPHNPPRLTIDVE